MKKFIILISIILICEPCFAAALQQCKAFPSDTPVVCYGPNYPPPAGTSTNVGIGTAGRLLVYTGSAAAGPSSSLFENTSSGNIGISSTNPGQNLDVQGTIRASSDVKVGTLSVCRSDGTNCPANGTVNSGTVNQVARYASTGSAVSGSSILYDTGTNIGIGTTTPLAQFAVFPGNIGLGTWTAAKLVQIGANTTTNAGGLSFGDDTYLFRSTTNTLTLGSSNQTTFKVVTGGDTFTLVPAGGNVQVQSSGTFNFVTNGSTTMNLDGSKNANFTNNVGIGTTLTTNAGLSVMSGNVGIGTWKPVGVLDIKTGSDVLIESGNVGIGTITAQGALTVMSGNVGIGTWKPESLFTVRGGNVSIGTKAANVLLEVVNTGAGNQQTIGVSNYQSQAAGVGTELLFQGKSADGTSQVRTAAIDSNWEGTTNDANFIFYTRKAGTLTEQVRITGSGNVGIGSTNPGTTLDINGTTRIPSGNLVVAAGNVGIGTSAAPPYLLMTNGSAPSDSITARNATTTGNVALVSLDSSGSAARVFKFSSGQAGTHFGMTLASSAEVSSSSGAIAFGAQGASNVYIGSGTANTPGITIDTNNNVGISNVSPGVALDVTGQIRGSQFSGQTDGTILCKRTGGGIGYCSGVIAGIACTCN